MVGSMEQVQTETTTYGQRIRRLRDVAGINQADLADALQHTGWWLNRRETGHNDLTAEEYMRLILALDCLMAARATEYEATKREVLS